MNYNELTRCRFQVAAHAGVLLAASGNAGSRLRRGSAGSREVGTWVQFDVRISVDKLIDTVQSVRFLAFGCPHVIAVCDWLAECSVGMPAVAKLPVGLPALQAEFAIPIEKLGRLLIIEDAWSAALSIVPSASGVG